MAHDDTAGEARPPEPAAWLDDPRTADRILWGLGTACVLALGAGLLTEGHGPFAIEHVFGFYAAFGFIAGFAVVLLAKAFRALVHRPEDYYDR